MRANACSGLLDLVAPDTFSRVAGVWMHVKYHEIPDCSSFKCSVLGFAAVDNFMVLSGVTPCHFIEPHAASCLPLL